MVRPTLRLAAWISHSGGGRVRESMRWREEVGSNMSMPPPSYVDWRIKRRDRQAKAKEEKERLKPIDQRHLPKTRNELDPSYGLFNQTEGPPPEGVRLLSQKVVDDDYEQAVADAALARKRIALNGGDPSAYEEYAEDKNLHLGVDTGKSAPVYGGIPPALSVYPKLQSFPYFQPRRYHDIPIGNTRTPINVQVQRSLTHLYHDLGVLVWEGCNGRQIEQIGNIITNVLRLGGPGRGKAFLRTWQPQEAMPFFSLSNIEVLPSIDKQRTGILAPSTLLEVTNNTLRIMLRDRQDEVAFERGKRYPLETGFEMPGVPTPRGIISETILNPRYHRRIVASCSLRIEHNSGRIIGSAELYTMGAEDFLGHCSVSYIMLQMGPKGEVAMPVWGNRVLPETYPLSSKVKVQTINEYTSLVLRPLWQLEREIWLDKAQAADEKIKEHNSKVAKEKSRLKRENHEIKARQQEEKRERREGRQKAQMETKAKRKQALMEWLEKHRVKKSKAQTERKARAADKTKNASDAKADAEGLVKLKAQEEEKRRQKETEAAAKAKARQLQERTDPEAAMRLLKKPLNDPAPLK